MKGKLSIYIGFYFRKALHDIVVNLVPRSILLKLTSCRQVVDHANALDRSQYSFSQRFGIFMHKWFCQCCWIYEQQLLAMKKGAGKVDAADMKEHMEKSGADIAKMCNHVIEEHSRKEANS